MKDILKTVVAEVLLIVFECIAVLSTLFIVFYLSENLRQGLLSDVLGIVCIGLIMTVLASIVDSLEEKISL